MIRYKFHAKEQMEKRGITEEEVEYCLHNYNVSHTDVKGNPIFKADLSNGKRIKVVIDKNSKEPTIITVVYC